MTRNWLARVRTARGDLVPGGPEMAARGVDLLASLVEQDPERFDRKVELMRVQRLSAEAALAAGRYAVAEAEAEAESAVTTAEEIRSVSPGHRLADLEHGVAPIALGDAWARLGHDPDSSVAAWRRANESLAPLAKGTGDWMYLSAAATALTRLGRHEEARPLLDALRSQGADVESATRR